MIANVYRYKNRFVVPTVTRTPDGIFIEAEPVDVVALEDAVRLATALERVMRAGNPRVPAPDVTSFPKPVLLRPANARSWGEFQRSAVLWRLEWEDGPINLLRTRREPDGGWSEITEGAESFAGSDAVLRIAKRLSADPSS